MKGRKMATKSEAVQAEGVLLAHPSVLNAINTGSGDDWKVTVYLKKNPSADNPIPEELYGVPIEVIAAHPSAVSSEVHT